MNILDIFNWFLFNILILITARLSDKNKIINIKYKILVRKKHIDGVVSSNSLTLRFCSASKSLLNWAELPALGRKGVATWIFICDHQFPFPFYVVSVAGAGAAVAAGAFTANSQQFSILNLILPAASSCCYAADNWFS